MRVRVKICGITNLRDAEAAIQAGADALGFVFYAASPRHVDPASARDIISHLPPLVSKVGVFVDAPEAPVREIASDCGLDTLQFHGAEPADYCLRFTSLKIIKAFRIRDADSLNSLAAYGTHGWLLDTYTPGAVGGTGQCFNWDLALAATKLGTPIILAGGLTPKNVGAAIRQVRPYAVDASSALEAAPGKKDPEAVRAFVAAVRAAEQETPLA